MTPPTPSEQHAIIEAAYPTQLYEVTANLDYLVAMVNEWMGGRFWSAKDCPPRFQDVCSIVLGDDPSIPKSLYGHDEAALRELSKQKTDDQVRYYQDIERIAVEWLWAELHGSICTEQCPIPANVFEND